MYFFLPVPCLIPNTEMQVHCRVWGYNPCPDQVLSVTTEDMATQLFTSREARHYRIWYNQKWKRFWQVLKEYVDVSGKQFIKKQICWNLWSDYKSESLSINPMSSTGYSGEIQHRDNDCNFSMREFFSDKYCFQGLTTWVMGEYFKHKSFWKLNFLRSYSKQG